MKHLKAHLKTRRLRELEPRDVEAYFRRRNNQGAKPRTLNNERALLRSFFKYAVEIGYLARSPMGTVKKFREQKRNVRTLTETQERRLLEAARKVDDQTYGFILCLLRSGLRRGTVGELEWRDIDFEQGEWNIPARKMKSREDFTGRPILPDLLEYLKNRRQPAGLTFGALQAENWQEAIKQARLQEYRPHDLRRCFVTECRRRGVPMEVAMFLSDHRDLATVLKCYRAIGQDEVRHAVRLLSGTGSGTPAARLS